MPLNCWKVDDDLLIDNGSFRLRLSLLNFGITEFTYLKDAAWHEVVNPDGSGALYVPRLEISGVSGGPLVPHNSFDISISEMGRAFASCLVRCRLSNPTQGAGFHDYGCNTHYGIYENGDLFLATELENDSGSTQTITLEEHLLDPKDDADISLDKDTATPLKYAGFYSNNTGSSSSDLSHDGILIQFGTTFDTYITDTSGDRNAVGLGKASITWPDGIVLHRYFRLHISCTGSPADVVNLAGFLSMGTAKALDYQNPDPLTGGVDEGDVITGSLSGDGFAEGVGAYTFNAV